MGVITALCQGERAILSPRPAGLFYLSAHSVYFFYASMLKIENKDCFSHSHFVLTPSIGRLDICEENLWMFLDICVWHRLAESYLK